MYLKFLLINSQIFNKYLLSAYYVLGIIQEAMTQSFNERAHNLVDKDAEDGGYSDFRIFPEFHGILWVLLENIDHCVPLTDILSVAQASDFLDPSIVLD